MRTSEKCLEIVMKTVAYVYEFHECGRGNYKDWNLKLMLMVIITFVSHNLRFSLLLEKANLRDDGKFIHLIRRLRNTVRHIFPVLFTPGHMVGLQFLASLWLHGPKEIVLPMSCNILSLPGHGI